MNNYIGIIIGAKGVTQKQLEYQSNCRISIRGKGSSQYRRDFDTDEKLHVLVQAESEEDLDKGIELIERLLKGEQLDATSETNRNKQLQLQIVSNVLKDEYCENCHEPGHRHWACPNKSMNKVIVRCAICGDYSHPSSDCPDRKAFLANNNPISIEAEYRRLKNEVEGKGELMLEDSRKGGMNFITEDNNLVKMITNQPSWDQSQDLHSLAIQMGLPLDAVQNLKDGSLNSYLNQNAIPLNNTQNRQSN